MSASASATGTEPPEYQTIYGVDPGPVNCGWAELRVKADGTVDVVNVDIIEFRKSGADTSDYCASLIDNTAQWFADHADMFANDEILFIENQRPDIGSNGATTRGYRPGQANNFVRTEALAIQTVFQAMLSKTRCKVVAPHAVKAHFSKHFPRVENYTAKDGQARQYAQDKKNAIVFGRSLTPDSVLRAFKKRWPKKKEDDAMDAVCIALYGAERFLDRAAASGVLEKPKPSKRRNNPDRPRSAAKRKSSKASSKDEISKKKQRISKD